MAYHAAPLRFAGQHTANLGDWDLRIAIDGNVIDMCHLAETLTIAHGENESYVANFTMLPERERKQIDPYVWYTKKIEIDVIHAAGSLRVFTGIVDKMGVNVLKGRFEIHCSDRRERQINALPAHIIRAIGYTSKSAHGERFDSLVDELEKRLATVPASFEFDAYGTPYLTAWREKAVADFVLMPCMIYQTEPMVTLAGAGDVLNQVKATVEFAYGRLRQRSITYSYDSEQNPCNYALYQRIASIEDIKDAADQTDWKLWGYNFNNVERSGWYDCGGTRRMGWIRDYVARDEDGATRRKFASVKNGTFEMVKRWQQNVGAKYVLTLNNAASASRYEFNAQDNISFTVNSEQDAQAWLDYDPHEKGLDYDEGAESWHFPLSRQPVMKGVDFIRASNGDWVANLTGIHDLTDTLRVAWHTAYTTLLASHRQNTVELTAKFLPEIDLRHTHEIVHSHIQGRCKVQHFEHEIDFRAKRAKTRIRYAFFQNAADTDALTEFVQPAPPREHYVSYIKRYQLGKKEIDERADASQAYGMVYRYRIGADGRKRYTPVHFAIYAPEIEAVSTDTAQEAGDYTYEVGIFNTDLVLRI